MTDKFPAGVAEQIGWYVYLYIDPFTEEIFYVGKGKVDRVFSHLKEKSDSEKCARIADIRRRKKEPKLVILRHNLPDEKTAYLVESVAIDLLKNSPLTNLVRGHECEESGLSSVEMIVSRYAAKPAKVIDAVMLIRVNQLFNKLMNPEELYEATRGVWKSAREPMKQGMLLRFIKVLCVKYTELINGIMLGVLLTTLARTKV